MLLASIACLVGSASEISLSLGGVSLVLVLKVSALLVCIFIVYVSFVFVVMLLSLVTTS